MMEPLGHPKHLQTSFNVPPRSNLESFLQKGKSLPHTSEPSTSQPSSQDGTKDLEDLNGRFRHAFAAFAQVDDSLAFIKELQAISELSLSLLPTKKAYAKSLESALNEFLEPEEKGGLPEETIREVVQEVNRAHEGTFELFVDRKILQELLTYLQKKQENTSREGPSQPRSAPPKRKRVHRMADSDEEEEDEEDEEDEVPSVEVGEEEAAEEEEEEGEKGWSEADYLLNKRLAVAAVLQPERVQITRFMDEVLEKVRNKRGYNWLVAGKEIVDAPTDDSIQVRPAMEERIVRDPITQQPIQRKAVKSKKCAGAHLYEEETVKAMIRSAQARDARGMRCAYTGCLNYILQAHLVEDEQYTRFLARTAQEEEAQL